MMLRFHYGSTEVCRHGLRVVGSLASRDKMDGRDVRRPFTVRAISSSRLLVLESKDCKVPNIRLSTTMCVASNTACQPGSAPLNDSDSGFSAVGNNSCGAVERCKQCPPGKVSADGGKCVACSEGNRVANQEQVACEGCGPGTEPAADRSRCID